MIKKNKYLNSLIYKISSYSRPDLVYVGSTYNSLKKRFSRHKSDFRAFNVGKSKTYISSFEIIKLGDCYIEKIEDFPCETRKQLLLRERHFFETMECVNKFVPYLNDEERKNCDIEINCGCGLTIRKKSKKNHEKSVKHQAYLSDENQLRYWNATNKIKL